MYYHIIKFVKFTHDIKVRLQTMPPIKPGETPLYKGTFDCAMQTIRKEVGWTFNIMDLLKKIIDIICFNNLFLQYYTSP